MRRRGKVDANQAAIVAALRQVGAQVQILAAVGGGCPDLLIGYKGSNYLIEAKNLQGFAARKSRGLTAEQVKWHATWTGQKAIVFTPQEALKIIGAVK